MRHHRRQIFLFHTLFHQCTKFFIIIYNQNSIHYKFPPNNPTSIPDCLVLFVYDSYYIKKLWIHQQTFMHEQTGKQQRLLFSCSHLTIIEHTYKNIPGDHSPGTSTNLYPTPHTVWIYSFFVTFRSFWRIFLMIQNTALLTSTGSSFQTAR